MGSVSIIPPTVVTETRRVSNDGYEADSSKKALQTSEVMERFKMSVTHMRHKERIDDSAALITMMQNYANCSGSSFVSGVKDIREKATEALLNFIPESLFEERLLLEEHSVAQLLRSAVRGRTDSRAETEGSSFAIWVALVYHHVIGKSRPVNIFSEMMNSSPSKFRSLSAYYRFLRSKQ